MTLANGKHLGQYVIVSQLGAGGMGEVYRARDAKLNRDVAIKVLPEGLAESADYLSRFEREARAVAALQHPNIMSIFDFGTEQGVSYAVMELLDGETLRARIAAGLSQRKVIEFALQIANGLAAAHQKGIIHRDIKPENIFVTTDERVKILDFGLAKQSGLKEEDHDAVTGSFTQPGTVMGTVGYMAPEQVRGTLADGRADIFAFGAVLYEMITGNRAFKAASSVETMSAILSQEPPEMSTPERPVPSGLGRVVDRCLEKNPDRRFQSAADLAFALDNLTSASTMFVPSGSSPALDPAHPSRSGVTRSAPSQKFLALGTGLVLLLGAGAFAGGRWTGMHRRPGAGAAQGVTTFTRLAELPGGVGTASLAPDGSSFVFVGFQAGNADIYFQRVGGRNPINLTKDAPFDDSAPAFSPDGQQIAFRSERGAGGIFVMGATGESVKKITEVGYDPSWSPDGKELIVATQGISNPLSRLSGQSELWAVELASGKRRLVYAGDAVQPSWSPHGDRIAYWSVPLATGAREIWTIEAKGTASGAKPVAVVGDAFVNWSPTWSPDGKFIYYSSDRGGTMNIWRIPIDEKSGKVLGESEAITTPSRWSSGISLSRDGRQMVYSSLDKRSDIRTVAFDPGKETVLKAPATVLPDSSEIRGLDLSPDGQFIAFTTMNRPESLFSVKIDGTQFLQITDDASRDRGARWSPDGKRIGFYSNRSGRFELWSVEPDGSGLKQLTTTTGSGIWYPTWSPDGLRIAAPDAQKTRIFTLGAKEAPKELPPIDATHRFWVTSWSPDGRSLAGAALESDGSIEKGFYRYTLETGRYEQLSATGTYPRFLSDGRRILYIEREEGGLHILDTRSKAEKKILSILPGSKSSSLWGLLSISKDDRLISFVETKKEGGVWMMKF